MVKPDYRGGGIVNLMCSIATAMGVNDGRYPEAALLDPADLSGARNIILMVIDGLGYDYLSRQGQGGFMAGHCLGSLTSVCPSTTASAIPTFLTAVAPAQHGFTGWFTYFRELGDILAVLPFRSRHGGESLSERGRSPLELSGVAPLVSRIEAASCSFVMPSRIVDSGFNRAYGRGARQRAYSDMKGFIKAVRASVPRRGRSYTYAYWPDYDSLAHVHGVDSREVSAHFQKLDEGLQQLVKSLRGSDTALLITADHGFIDSTPETTLYLHDHPELQRTLLLPLCGEPRFGFCYVHPRRESGFRSYIESELSHAIDLYPSLSMIEQGWFGEGTSHPSLGERVGHYTLVMRENYKIKDWILGERPYTHIGVHGGVSRQEMLVPLIHRAL